MIGLKLSMGVIFSKAGKRALFACLLSLPLLTGCSDSNDSRDSVPEPPAPEPELVVAPFQEIYDQSVSAAGLQLVKNTPS